MEQFTCLKKNMSIVGWQALYDICMKQFLEEGSVLVYFLMENNYTMFQLGKKFNLLVETQVEILPGSIVTIINGKVMEEPVEIDHTDISFCRFPTKQELELYDKASSI